MHGVAQAASGDDGPTSGPLSPDDALRAFDVREGFVVELVAAEPLVADPVAFDWSADGKLYVVEMGDYPLGTDNKGKPGGRVVYLEDADGDGRYEKSTVFLEGLLFPSGIMAWREGVLVACAPEIFYASDTDGDGRADVRKPLFVGFGEVNPQHRVNALSWGLDNWVHCANGDFAPVRDRASRAEEVKLAESTDVQGATFSSTEDVRRLGLSGAQIRSVRTGAEFDIRNRDLRIRPDTGDLDPQTGQSQYGRARDDWGNWFACNHATPMWHYVLADEYLRRNPFVIAPDPRHTPAPSVTFPAGARGRETGTLRSPQGNPFTSACSITIYRDDLFGPDFADNWFVCEPVHNVVHREILVPAGFTYESRRPADETDREFLSSHDTWFTPAMARTGPDGALWVADMYRQVLEHPNWLPPGWEETVDVRAGAGLGRIYRIYPRDHPPRPIPRLDRRDAAGLVAALDSPNGWQRDAAQRLLVEQVNLVRSPASFRGAKGDNTHAVAMLEELVRSAERAVCRLHAMCTLDGLNALSPSILQTALKDPHPGVRRHAVRVAQRHLSAKFSNKLAKEVSNQTELGRSIAALARDQDPQVRLQVAYTLGYWRDHSRAGAALGLLLAGDNVDPYLTAAVLSSVNKGNLSGLVATLHSKPDRAPPPPLWEALFRTALGFKQDKAAIKLVELVVSKGPDVSDWQFDCLARLIGVLDSRRTTLSRWATASGPGMEAAVKRLKPVFEAAQSDAASADTPLPRWTLAIALLARDGNPNRKDLDLLSELAAPQSDAQKQEAAINALARLRGKQVPRRLLSGWKGYSPARRSQVLEALSSREPWMAILLEAIERGDVLPTEIDAVARERLLASPNPTLRAAAQKLLADQVDPDREGVVEAYRAALEIDGDVEAGRDLFARTCAVCHQIGALGRQVGPDLAMVRQKPADWFLPALFDPSRAVDARYVNYVAITTDGRTLTGVLAGETGNSLTMVGPDGKHQSLLRSDLDALSSTGKSAMPTGLEKDLKPADVANLIAFLREAPLPKVVEGNSPALVQPDELGRLELKAANCEIYGDEIRIYDKHTCLGWWTKSGDHAVWYVELPAAGRYAATIDYSCDDTSSGQGWVLEGTGAGGWGLGASVLEVSGERLEGTVDSTGDWETYKQVPVGELRLEAGLNRLVFRSAGEIKESTYLIDLKGIVLEPVSGAGRSGS